ncbi:24164_t:CDS:2, partial [Gigaspora margarita]
DSIIKGKKISDLSNCSKCRKEIISHPFKAFATLSCEHDRKHSIQFQDITEILEENMPDVDDNRDSKSNHPTGQSTIPLEKEFCKRSNKDTPENKLS